MNPSNRKKKLCYVLPEYNSKSHTHFAYITDFLKEISSFFDIFLIIEKGERPQLPLGCLRIQVLRFKFLPLRWCELHCRLLYARSRGYKIFYAHYSFLAAFLAATITRLFGGRTFYWNCGLPWKYQRNLIRELFERLTYKAINYLVTGTEDMGRQYSQNYHLSPEKIKVMPNWINLKKVEIEKLRVKNGELRKRLGISTEEKTLLFVHRLSKRKGAYHLPEILNKLRDENVVLVIVGDGPDRKNIESKIKEYGLWNKARFAGWIPNNELASYYDMADVFIMPSEEEGFPHVLLEAMAAGAPVVAFDVGGAKDVLPLLLADAIVPVGRVDELVSKIKFFLSNSQLKPIIRDSERQQIKKFDIKNVVEKFKEILN